MALAAGYVSVEIWIAWARSSEKRPSARQVIVSFKRFRGISRDSELFLQLRQVIHELCGSSQALQGALTCRCEPFIAKAS